MATVSHFIPSLGRSMICSKGNLHEEQPLNLVCLDPLCRTSPLSCSICFTQIHKFHKVVGLNKFLDDYKRVIGSTNKNMLNSKILRHYNDLKQQLQNFKKDILKQIENFEKSIQKYVEHLCGQTEIRQCVGSQIKVELEPESISKIRNQSDLERSVRFVLNNSVFDQNLNLVNCSQILKQNEDRICALLDKMVYMTDFCQKTIKDSLSSLKFANETMKQEKVEILKKINRFMDAEPDPTSFKHYIKEKENLKKIIHSTNSLILQELQKSEYLYQWEELKSPSQDRYLFGKYRNKDLQIHGSGDSIKSNINAERPQYALAWPNINLQPLKCKEWSIKIKKCRDFASQNTMAIGISKFSDMKLANYKGKPTNCLLISSQGYVTLNEKQQKTNFVYREGDVLNFKYDPYYQILEVSKQNGRKLSLKGLGSEQPVYICTRFTYASDQVQFV